MKIDTTKLEQAIEHINKALELIDEVLHPQPFKLLEFARQALWDEVAHAERWEEIPDDFDR
jgi:hypothetical protein